MQLARGDVRVQLARGDVRVQLARGDVRVQLARGDVRVQLVIGVGRGSKGMLQCPMKCVSNTSEWIPLVAPPPHTHIIVLVWEVDSSVG